MSNYNPRDHYWLRGDGMVFSSRRLALLDPTDAEYIDWVEMGGQVTPWPRDENGAQTEAALQDVLTPWGLIVNQTQRLIAYATKKHMAVVDSGVVYNLAAEGQPALNVHVDTDANGRSFLSGAVELTALDPTHVFTWVQDSGDVPLTGDQIRQIGVSVGHFVQDCFEAYGQVLAGIRGGSITTIEQIDAASWPTH